MLGFEVSVKVLSVPERIFALAAWKRWIMFLQVRVEKMPLRKYPPAFIASQGIFGGLHLGLRVFCTWIRLLESSAIA
jgi:hypothetical protein